MSLFRRLTVLAGAVEVARRYAKSNPDKAGKALDSATEFVDKQTKGRYSDQIAGVARKVKDAAGIPQPGYGFGGPGTVPPAPPQPYSPPQPSPSPRPAAGNPPTPNGGQAPQQPPAVPPVPPNPSGPQGS